MRDGEAGEQFTLALYQIHLPKPAETGFVDWNPEADRVRRGPQFDAIEPVLEFVEAHRDELPDRWP